MTSKTIDLFGPQMEIQFEQQESNKCHKMVKNGKNNKSRNKFVGVRQRASGRWVAEIKDTTHKIRMWLGTFETAEEAARAYDEAACLLRGSNTRTNFVTPPLRSSQNSPLASRIKNLLHTKRKSNTKSQESCMTSPSTTTDAADCQHTSADATTTTAATTVFECANYDHSNYTMFEDVYKPDFSHFDHLPWTEILHGGGGDAATTTTFDDNIFSSEFERMKVERQISASLYAINGVQEYMDMADHQPTFMWDLPPICPLPC